MKKLLLALWLLATASAETPEPAPVAAPAPADVRQRLSDGVAINWTTLELEVTERAQGYGVSKKWSAIEQQARQLVGPGILSGARSIPVTPELGYDDLEQDPKLGEPLRSRTERWGVSEARYYSSGAVELVGVLSLRDLLKPWTLAVAKEPPPPGGEQPPYTGVVVDARGTGFQPAFAPQIVSDTGEVLYDGFLWEEEAIDRAPVLYVADPTHPLVADRVGAEPLSVKAGSATGSRAHLVHEDAVRFKTAMQRARVMGEGKVVVVVDAP
jgi:hypothetical protein